MEINGASPYNQKKNSTPEQAIHKRDRSSMEIEAQALAESSYKKKEKQLLDELSETIQAVEALEKLEEGDQDEIQDESEVGLYPPKENLVAKITAILQAIQKLDEDNREEKQMHKVWVAELLGRNETEVYVAGEQLTGACVENVDVQLMNSSSKDQIGTGKFSGNVNMSDFLSLRASNNDRKLMPRRGCLVNEIGNEEANVHPCTDSVRQNDAKTFKDKNVLSEMGLSDLTEKNIVDSLSSGNEPIAPTLFSYADKVKGGNGNTTCGAEVRPGMRSYVQLRHYSFVPGSPIMDLEADEGTVEKLSNCIVKHFLGARMDFYDVRKKMFNQWESSGIEKMWCTDNGINLFKFQSTNRIDEILDEAYCHVFGKVMVLKRWHKMQKLSKEAVFKVPIWVKLYDLPFVFWLGESLADNLSKIVSRIGRPPYMDMATEKGMRLSFARVCVEIDVSATLPSSISIEFGGECVDVKMKYQWVPPKCETCSAFGHREAYCPQKQSSIQSKHKTNLGGKTNPKSERNGCIGVKVVEHRWKVVQRPKWDSRVSASSNREESSDIDDVAIAPKVKN